MIDKHKKIEGLTQNKTTQEIVDFLNKNKLLKYAKYFKDGSLNIEGTADNLHDCLKFGN